MTISQTDARKARKEVPWMVPVLTTSSSLACRGADQKEPGR